MIPVAISVASENYVGTLTTHSYFSRLSLLPSDYPNYPHAIIKYEPYYGSVRKVYFFGKHDKNML